MRLARKGSTVAYLVLAALAALLAVVGCEVIVPSTTDTPSCTMSPYTDPGIGTCPAGMYCDGAGCKACQPKDVCDGYDNDCDGIIDDGPYSDKDGDGYTYCGKVDQTTFALKDVDCNDNDPKIYPGATEICNGKDDNCDGIVDNANLVCPPNYTCVPQSGRCVPNGGTTPDGGLLVCTPCSVSLTPGCCQSPNVCDPGTLACVPPGRRTPARPARGISRARRASAEIRPSSGRGPAGALGVHPAVLHVGRLRRGVDLLGRGDGGELLRLGNRGGTVGDRQRTGGGDVRERRGLPLGGVHRADVRGHLLQRRELHRRHHLRGGHPRRQHHARLHDRRLDPAESDVRVERRVRVGLLRELLRRRGGRYLPPDDLAVRAALLQLDRLRDVPGKPVRLQRRLLPAAQRIDDDRSPAGTPVVPVCDAVQQLPASGAPRTGRRHVHRDHRLLQ